MEKGLDLLWSHLSDKPGHIHLIFDVDVEEISGICLNADKTTLLAVLCAGSDEDNPKLYKYSFEF